MGRVCDNCGYEVSGMHGSQAERLGFVLGVVETPPIRLLTLCCTLLRSFGSDRSGG